MEIFRKETIIGSRCVSDSLAETAGQAADGGDIFRALEEAATDHVRVLGFNHEKLEQFNAVWILVSQSVEFIERPRIGQKVQVVTWPGKTRFTLFPRYYQIEDEDGQILVKASSYWSLLDMESRNILSPKKIGVMLEPTVTGTEISMTGHIAEAESPAPIPRTVTEKDLDSNGHMNNAVYIDWICDLLGDKSLTSCSRISIQYKNELRLGDEAQLFVQNPDDRTLITGKCADKTSFCAEVLLNPES